jgi:hypothetical protein
MRRDLRLSEEEPTQTLKSANQLVELQSISGKEARQVPFVCPVTGDL